MLTCSSLSQEREAKKETWKPRWFKANPGGPVFDGEHPEDKCPLWDFTGEALQQPKRPVQPDGAGSYHPAAARHSVHACMLLHSLDLHWAWSCTYVVLR